MKEMVESLLRLPIKVVFTITIVATLPSSQRDGQDIQLELMVITLITLIAITTAFVAALLVPNPFSTHSSGSPVSAKEPFILTLIPMATGNGEAKVSTVFQPTPA